MLPAIALIIACYTSMRFVEVLAAKDTRAIVRSVAIPLLLLSFVSCSVVVFSGASGTTP